MKAKDMFEKLGYIKVDTIDEKECILYQNKDVSIYIFLNKQEIRKQYNGIVLICNITFKELQAINQQMKEIGVEE